MGIPYAEVIGDPIAHSKSPVIHKFWLEKLGLEYDFRRTRVKPDELATFFEGRRADPDWCGCSVTLPHKGAVMDCLDEISGDARLLEAVNCIVRTGAKAPRLAGRNTDWRGFMEPLRPWLASDPLHKIAHVIGAGGAAAAISYALDHAGFTIVSINRDVEKALALRRRLELFDDDLVGDLLDWTSGKLPGLGDRTETLDLLVNATPLGMEGFPPLPFTLEGFPPNLLVYDIVYHPLETELLRAARASGRPAIDGLAMLIGQAAEAFELFFNDAAPREHDAELRERLTR